MKLPALIYLDAAFITQTYESVKQISMPIRVVKKSNTSGGVSAGLIHAGASMEESREFPVSTGKMYDELADHLAQIPEVNLDGRKDDELPELFWTEGIFGGGHSTIERGSEVTASGIYFEFYTSLDNKRRHMPLITNDAYFVSGYDQLLKYGYVLTVGFGIRAKLLIRLLFLDENYPVGAPMVIIKTSNTY